MDGLHCHLQGHRRLPIAPSLYPRWEGKGNPAVAPNQCHPAKFKRPSVLEAEMKQFLRRILMLCHSRFEQSDSFMIDE